MRSELEYRDPCPPPREEGNDPGKSTDAKISATS